jgi:hypothetical protein
VAGGPARADFLDYLTKGAIIWGLQIGFDTGTETNPEVKKISDFHM